jgi:hypothetical protein
MMPNNPNKSRPPTPGQKPLRRAISNRSACQLDRGKSNEIMDLSAVRVASHRYRSCSSAG